MLPDRRVLLRQVEPERLHRPDRQRQDLLSGDVGGVFVAPLNLRDQVRLSVRVHERQRVFVLEFGPKKPERKPARAQTHRSIR